MLGETVMGLSALKSAFDMAKALKDIDNATGRNAAVIELQEKILTAQEAQAALVKRIDELEKHVAEFEAWEREKQRYQLKNPGYGAFVYVLKPDERGVSPPHWVCANCYEHKHIATLHYGSAPGKHGFYWVCPACKTDFDPGGAAKATWLD